MSLQPSQKDMLQKIQRIHRLSEKPPNPSFAYRNLDHIHTLSEMLLQALLQEQGLEIKDLTELLNPPQDEMAEHWSKRVS